MKVLLTGTTGFLGSHLARTLLEAGHEVHGFTRAGSDLARLGDCSARIVFHTATDGGLDRLFSLRPVPDAVVHLATCYGREGEKDSEVAGANTVFPLALLESAAAKGVRTFINADTCINEWPLRYAYLRSYVLSKRHFAEWGHVLGNAGRIRFLNLKLHHPYGPYDNKTKFVSQILRDCLTNAGEIPLTGGEQKKDFIYVDDVTAAFVLLIGLADRLPGGAATYECGSGNAISIREFVETAHRLTRSRARLSFGALPYRENEFMFRQADTSGLKSLGWVPQYNLEQGIRETLAKEYGFA